LLLIAAIPALLAMPRALRWVLVATSGVISLAVSMTREEVPVALRLVLSDGPTLPVLLVLRRMASGYDVPLPPGAFWIVASAVLAVLALIWRPVLRGPA
ncbi:MAG TPA: hypothetical protein VFZ73_01990, partial [Gemmatimonadaceae bacterium]